ncbi:MAG: DUF3791 domain-containing protein [Endomicrobium sp.]|jgi:hypothetical protein|nr:DUF3791 domain-containing protein [Endomicrobium sp.]
MSLLSFETFCIEFYAEHTNSAGFQVYDKFVKSGLLEMLKTDYEDLHGMSFEWLMRFFDDYLRDK